MNPSIIIMLAIFMAFIPASLASDVPCAKCKSRAWEVWRADYPVTGKCGYLSPDGKLCKEERSKMYYLCTNESCQKITIRNKRCLLGKQEGCTHENKFIYDESSTPSNHEAEPPEASSEGTSIRSEMIDGKTFYYFLE
ncbi:hypothetical protein PGTUg99_021377 [Puccinia graminis f. sp. tritici]|uniref:Secreted protein n=1 Tax=Puccinia graminis f. sp. tritici TaxID=56615 RepID=A0A5B0Q493_PUCGR|nr:hypothetical protein PGTUg99_027284 [Puccinia graminis f. sp. tritici]KAA1115654.1 hypothetical protein PGTUg99_021377 [Puccinia graminis f. sp. tritici]